VLLPDGGTPTTPTVTSTEPANGSTDVALNARLTINFSEAMDPATINTNTFTLTSASGPVQGTVYYSHGTAVFLPAAHLASGASLTATLTTFAKSEHGVSIAAAQVWRFTTGSTLAAGVTVSLGKASTFVILAKSGVSTVPMSVVTGNVGVSPSAGTFLTGFSMTADSTNNFSTSTQVVGRLYAADDAPPTPSNLTTAVGDMELAFIDAAGRAPDVTELGAGNIGGMTLSAGVYKWGTGLLIPTDITLNGSATDVWVFQVAQSLTFQSAARVQLTGGALAKNVFWQVAGLVELGTTAHCEGVILTKTGITLRTGATVTGRLLAQTAVVIDTATVVEPAL
jgi:hypothetical protein